MELSWKTTWKVLALIVLLGALLRFYHLGENSFVADEFLDINSSYGYTKTNLWKAWDFNEGKLAEINQNDARDERAFVYKWQVAQIFRYLPPTEAVARSVSVFWGMLSLLVIFWATRIFTGKKEVALVATFLCAVSISALIFSRRLRMYAMFFPLYLAAATSWYAFYELEYRGKWSVLRTLWIRFGVNGLYLFPALLLSLLTYLTHQLTPHIALSIGLFALIMAGKRAWQGKGWQNKYAVTVGLGLTGIILLIFLAPGFVRAFLGGLTFFDDHFSYVGYVLSDFGLPLIGLLLGGFGLLALAKQQDSSNAAYFLGSAFFLPLLMAIFLWNRNAGAQYIFFVQSFWMILVAFGVYQLFSILAERFRDFGKWFQWVLMVLFVAIIPAWGYFLEENNTYHETSSSSNPNYRKVFAYFKKNQAPTDALITRNFRNYYWSGAKVPVYDFGGEVSHDKLTLADVQQAMREHSTGWLIISTNDYDYITHEAEDFFKKNLTLVSNSQVRGEIEVYQWGVQ